MMCSLQQNSSSISKYVMQQQQYAHSPHHATQHSSSNSIRTRHVTLLHMLGGL